MAKYFTKKEALQDLQDTLAFYDGYICDLHNETFNTDYYIIGTYEAEKALEQYGVFKAIHEIQEYEKDNFGEIYTDLSDPEKIANMLYYIIGYNVFCELKTVDKYYDESIDPDIRQEILDEIETLIKQ